MRGDEETGGVENSQEDNKQDFRMATDRIHTYVRTYMHAYMHIYMHIGACVRT